MLEGAVECHLDHNLVLGREQSLGWAHLDLVLKLMLVHAGLQQEHGLELAVVRWAVAAGLDRGQLVVLLLRQMLPVSDERAHRELDVAAVGGFVAGTQHASQLELDADLGLAGIFCAEHSLYLRVLLVFEVLCHLLWDGRLQTKAADSLHRHSRVLRLAPLLLQAVVQLTLDWRASQRILAALFRELNPRTLR